MKGGFIYTELPVHDIFKLVEGDPSLFKKMFIPFKEELYMFYSPSMVERLRDVLRVKAMITYNAKHLKAGVFDTKIDYTFTHADYSEETGTLHVEGKSEKAFLMEVVSKNEAVLPKHVLHPFKLEASFKPNAEFKVVFKGTHDHLEMTITKAAQTFKIHTIYNHHEKEHTYDVEVNVGDKKMTVVHKEDGNDMTHLDFELQGNLMSLTMIKMSGKIQATRWFEAGKIESVFVVKGDDYEFKVIHNTNEVMKTKMNVKNHMLRAKINLNMTTYKGTVYVNYDTAKNVFEIIFPKEWFADGQKFGLKVAMKSLTPGKPWLGGVHTVLLLRNEVPFIKFDVDFQFTRTAEMYKLVFNNVHVESLNAALVNSFFDLLPITKYEFCHKYLINGCFEKGDFTGSLVWHLNVNKFTVKGTVKKMDVEVFDVILDTVSSPYHFAVFYPHFFQRMFNKPMERLTLDVVHEDHTLTMTTNYDNLKFKFERAPQHFSTHILKNDVPYVVFEQDYHLDYDSNMFLFTMKPTLHFHEDSYIHKEFCQFSSYMCFHDMKGDIHVEVADTAAKKVDVKATIHQDEHEVYHLEVTNKQAPYMFVFKTPYVVPFFKYIRGQSWFEWMMPIVKSPFDVLFTFHPVEKSLMLKTNIDTHENVIQVVPTGGDKFNVEVNHEVVAEFVAADKNVEIVRTMKDGTPLKTVVTWTKGDLLENSATVTMMYKNMPQVVTFDWNLVDFTHGTFMVDVKGTKAPILGDFEFHRNMKWEVLNFKEFEVSWEGKSSSNVLQAITTPITTEANIMFKKQALHVKIGKTFNSKTYTLLFDTKPFKLAFLPFFEF